ncbi:MAG: hypothetical protein KDJ65_27565 [Anaerolineae bacterium]|nr:hypothetical protein [Anaerolineae bacterium]
MNTFGNLILAIKTTLPSFTHHNSTVSPSNPGTCLEDSLNAEIQWLEELSAQEALRLKHATRAEKTMAPLTPHQTIIDLAG